jgi:hypothetical protein
MEFLEPQSLDSKNATKSQQSPLDMTFANHRSSACFQHSFLAYTNEHEHQSFKLFQQVTKQQSV